LRLIYAGGLDPSKGVDLFLRAVEQIDSPLEIHICGKGPLEEKIVKLCSTSRHVATFHGLVSRKELLELMVHADVGVNAHRSDLHEGGSWPFKVVEYLATCGTVFCNSSGNIPMEMQAQLFLYQSNELSGITTAFRDFIQAWPSLQKSSSQRRAWALEQFGAKGIVNQLETLMAGKCVQVQAR
jgi:glycosyltransferase involved in cell wall biosynthesis